MKLLKLLTLFALIFAYLYFSYIRFYHFIGDVNLRSPYTVTDIKFNNVSAKGLTNYVALGDSLSSGVGASDVKETFTYQYALNLSKKYRVVNFYNYSWPGDSIGDVVTNQLPRALLVNPAVVTLLIGTNDVHNKSSLGDFREKYAFVLNELLTKTSAKILVIDIPYLGSEQIVYFPFKYLLNFRIRQFNSVIYDVVSKLNKDNRIVLVNLYDRNKIFISENSVDFYSADLFHPSGKGYLQWSQIINAN